MEIVKSYGAWLLTKYARTKYFKNSKPNLHVEIVYCIEHKSRFELTCDDPNRIETGIFWVKGQREALRTWSEFKRTHSIGGATLRDELFPIGGAK